MKIRTVILFVAGFSALGAPGASGRPQAQASAAATQTAQPAANPADVASVDALIGAMYDVISGPATKKRDWDRFRSLFHPGARLMRIGPAKEGGFSAAVLSPDDYMARAGKYFDTHGFFEQEIARKGEAFGNMQQIFSTYESRNNAGDTTPFVRGINSVLLFNDGKRWWILTIAWQEESPDLKLPTEYLPAKR
jgi:hypothetical protein